MIFELYVQRQVGEPGRRGLVAIEMNFLAGGRKVVGISDASRATSGLTSPCSRQSLFRRIRTV
jgi:hypothetical protein